jgi:hypothetical protein
MDLLDRMASRPRSPKLFDDLLINPRQMSAWHPTCCIVWSRIPVRQRDILKRWWGRAALAALALIILATGLCCFDQDQSGMDDHGIVMHLCFLLLLVPAVILPLAGLAPRGFVVALARPAFAAVPLAVPEPPPRRIRLA